MPTLRSRPQASTLVVAVVGFTGAALVAWSSYVVGTLAGHYLDKAAATGPYRWPYEIGVSLMVLAWLALGRLVLDPSATGSPRRVWAVGAAMAAPLLFSAPVTSQDVWAYLGQANVAAHGLDPYSVGPGAVPGPFAHAVAHDWVDTPSPYGPLWIGLCRVVVEIVQPHPWAGMFTLRLVALCGLVAVAAALHRLGRATGASPTLASWLVVAGPWPLLMLLGAVHNDAVMLAFLLWGVAVAATRPSMARAVLVGAVLVGLAGAVKVNALLVSPFLPLVWYWYAVHRSDGEQRPREPLPLRTWVLAGAACVVTSVAVLFLVGVLFGYDVGWVSQVGDGRIGVQWLSVPQQVGNVLHVLAPGQVADLRRDRWDLVHPVGLVFTALGLLLVTLTARRRPPMRTLAWLMLVPVIGVPAPRTWYLLWPLVFLVADRMPARLLAPIVGGAAALAIWYPPSVRPPVSCWLLVALFAVLTAAAWALERNASQRSAASAP